MLFNPIKAFHDAVNAMHKEFFTVYTFLIEKGVSHEVANKAALEAMASNFKKQVSREE